MVPSVSSPLREHELLKGVDAFVTKAIVGASFVLADINIIIELLRAAATLLRVVTAADNGGMDFHRRRRSSWHA